MMVTPISCSQDNEKLKDKFRQLKDHYERHKQKYQTLETANEQNVLAAKTATV